MEFVINLQNYSKKVRLGIIEETSDEKLINYAMNSEDSEERGAVASNPNISTEQLDKLSHDSSNDVQKCVLRNKKTLGETIDGMLDNNCSTPNENLIVNHRNVLRKTLERFLKTHTNANLRIKAEERLKYM